MILRKVKRVRKKKCRETDKRLKDTVPRNQVFHQETEEDFGEVT